MTSRDEREMRKMKRPIGRELAVLLLVAAGCSDGASNSNGGQGGAAAGHAGTTDGGAGGTGGADAGTGTGGATGTGGDAGADAGGSSYAWLLKAPDAKLYDANGVQVGTHGAGPSWTYGDGSVATGVKV